MAQDIVGSKMTPQPNLKDDKSGYGQNGYGGASSDCPGEHTESDLAKEHRAATDDGQGVHDIVIGSGSRSGAWQEREVSATQYPTTPGMRNRSHEDAPIAPDKRPVFKR